MTAQPTPSYLEYRPLQHNALIVTAVADLNAEQLALVTSPFLPNEKPKSIFTAETFSVTCDLEGVSLPEAYLIRCWVWVLGSAAQLAPISYLPVPAKPLKSKLWRLSPDQTGAEARDTDTVIVTLPRAMPVVRLALECRGLFDSTKIYTPPPGTP